MKYTSNVLHASIFATLIALLMVFNFEYASVEEQPQSLLQLSEAGKCTITIDCGSDDEECFSSTTGNTTVIVNGGVESVAFEGDCPIR
ncbi:MAG: hypothetical protein FH748_17055 [Balneolaceae bacterium]|nr:hypothetical protein [Balneolaceae bacterium]